MSSDDLTDNVRNWVHFDNLCLMLSRQINTARNLRNSFEEKILSFLGSEGKRLRIQGALLETATKKNSVGLNWATLEESLHNYYKSNHKPDETEDIIHFIKENRGVKSTIYLKKTPIVENTLTDIKK